MSIGAIVASIAAILWACAQAPTSWTCPRIDGVQTFALDGIRRDGSFSCSIPPLARDVPNVRGGWTSKTIRPPILVFIGRIFCPLGREPMILDDGATARCAK